MIIDNKQISHLQELKSLFSQSTEVTIASPFLSSQVYTLLDGLNFSKKLRSITLITVLASFDQSLSAPLTLNQFSKYCNDQNITRRILIDDKLHGKVYIFKTNSIPKCALVTSANFTHTGLNKNHEVGVMIDDSRSISELESNLIKGCKEITFKDIQKIHQASINFVAAHPRKKTPKDAFSPWQYIKDESKSEHTNNREYYIKPVGWTKEPYTEHKPLGQNLHFSKKRPNVKVGDILICYAVGPKHLLGYYEVLTEPAYDTNEERWPWYVKGRCLSPSFSNNFWNTGITLSKAVKRYQRIFPEQPMTSTGNTTLGALQWGSDKIKLDKTFSDYLISLIDVGYMSD